CRVGPAMTTSPSTSPHAMRPLNDPQRGNGHYAETRSSLQVGDPHNGDHVPVIEHLLFGVLVAGPDEMLFGRKGLFFLHHPQFAFGDMADHGIHHGGSHRLRSRLNDDVPHRDSLETGNDGRGLAISTLHDT